MVREAKQHEAEDRRYKERIDARNTAEATIYQVEKALRELNGQVPASDRATIKRTIEDLKVAQEGHDTARIKQLTEQLQQASHAIGQQMYAQQAAAQQAGGPETGQPVPEGGPYGGQEDVIDGEFNEA